MYLAHFDFTLRLDKTIGRNIMFGAAELTEYENWMPLGLEMVLQDKGKDRWRKAGTGWVAITSAPGNNSYAAAVDGHKLLGKISSFPNRTQGIEAAPDFRLQRRASLLAQAGHATRILPQSFSRTWITGFAL